jgi:hypothetical protein
MPHGTARGNTCYICGSPPRISQQGVKEPVIDSGMFIEMEGYLMFCSHCVEEMASLLHMTSAVKTKEMQEEVSYLQKELEDLKVKFSLSEDLVTAFTRHKDHVVNNQKAI